MLFLLVIVFMVDIALGQGGIDNCPEEVYERNGYGYSGPLGPKHWSEIKYSEACGEENQSPIDITDVDSSSEYPGLRFSGYDKLLKGYVYSDGFSVYLEPTDRKKRSLIWDENEYAFMYVQFYFSNEEDNGTQHAIDGKKYSLEMHMVHEREGSLVIVAVLYEEGHDPDEHLEDLIYPVSKLLYRTDKIDFRREIRLFDLLPVDCYGPDATKEFQSVYAYTGSIVIPPCVKVTSYFIFPKPVTITPDQMKEFRKQFATKKDADEPCMMYNNIRPLQARNGRVIAETTVRCREN